MTEEEEELEDFRRRLGIPSREEAERLLECSSKSSEAWAALADERARGHEIRFSSRQEQWEYYSTYYPHRNEPVHEWRLRRAREYGQVPPTL